MGDHLQKWYIRLEGESFDIDVYDDCPKSLFPCMNFILFTDSPNKKYIEGEITFVDMIDNADFKLDILNTVLSCIGTSDEDGEGDSEFEDANDIIDEELQVDKVEVNMSSFKFQLDGEDKTEAGTEPGGVIDPIQPHVTVTEEYLKVLDFDSLECDQEDVPENARSRGLRNLRKKATTSRIKNDFYVGKEFANMDLANERIIAYLVQSRRNLDFKRNDKRRIRVICKGVVPT
ncbi:hypothetical protein Tco_0810792 [Tanacetum coccineum]